MAVELYLQVVDDRGGSWLGETDARRPSSSGCDAQLLLDRPTDRAGDRPAPRVYLGHLTDAVQAGGSADASLPPAQVASLFGDAERTIDEALIEQVVVAFDAAVTAPGVGSPVEIWRFLRAHEGRCVCLVRDSGHEQGHSVAAMVAASGGEVADAAPDHQAAGAAPVMALAVPARAESEGQRDPSEPLPALLPGHGVVPADPAPSAAGVARWGAVADWLTLATLRVVVIGIVALHLFVLIGEALTATP